MSILFLVKNEIVVKLFLRSWPNVPPANVGKMSAAASQFRWQHFEGFKLRSLNLTHALFIQISRKSSIIDIVVPSKMAAGCHFVKKKCKKKKVA